LRGGQGKGRGGGRSGLVSRVAGRDSAGAAEEGGSEGETLGLVYIYVTLKLGLLG
jgi:hypothetical protein